MISFKPTEEEQQLIETVERFVRDEIQPNADPLDKTLIVDSSVVKKHSDLGLHLLSFPEQLGGFGLNIVAKLMVEKTIAKASAAYAVALDSAGLGAQAILNLGTLEQQSELLTPFQSDPNYSLAFAMTEANLASHTGYLQTTATKTSKGYVLNGEKMTVYNIGRANQVVILARTSEGQGLEGVQAFVVDTQNPGLKIGSADDRSGLFGSQSAPIQLSDCEVSEFSLLQGGDDPLKNLTTVLNIGRVINTARITGVADAAIDSITEYAQQRETFGKKICQHQGLAFFMVDMLVPVEAAHCLNLKAASQLDKNQDATVASCNAAIHANEAAVQTTIDAIQVFGGAGFMKDLPVERYMRDARTLANTLGTIEEHQEVLGTALYPAA
ncbi:MAG: hypothetical protein COB51_06770 [Moraxellaceae bacterium]|nr:MAG: hypothetical protein COB51_06770 [Moraxellaceae bacterium]